MATPPAPDYRTIGGILAEERAKAGKDILVKPAEIALWLRVDPKTINRWTNQGRLPSVRTPGGSHRYSFDAVTALLRESAVSGASR